ncbi:hypothetical protein S7711_00239 [Stachybotrys chartarum IBT 7711]|uniref:RNA 3'-terminal phosphate cyclase domain-containing protein n=1 Tax=Stachybotrys chartarum (strain CBS 109288 / IBT 7711) TaxID=1280523 RepID=A0A084B3W1_STACB|nr:hypothetical protein S7711_00239 [Stachybotrys chartarum IBT 7711]
MTTMHKVIDGTTLEGGGGLVRAAITYSSLLNTPVRLHSIRANRPNVQGLQRGHSTAIGAMTYFTAASVEGNQPYSRDLQFTPHAGTAVIDSQPPNELEVAVEGSASIFLIAVLPYLLFSRLAAASFRLTPTFDGIEEIHLKIHAGMLVLNAPSAYYMRQVFIPTLDRIGITQQHLRFTSECQQGWYNEGSNPINLPGKLVALVKPLSDPIRGFVFGSRGEVRKIQVTAHAPIRALPTFRRILKAEVKEAILTDKYEVEIGFDFIEGIPENQYHLLLTATTASPVSYLGYELIYPQNKRFPESIKGDEEGIATYLARACIRGLWKELRTGNSVDEHMEDILTIYQTMAVGFSSTIAKDHHMQVEEFSEEHIALGSDGELYDVDTSSIHQETSWWIAKHMAGIDLEEKIIDGRVRPGCFGVSIGEKMSPEQEMP